MPLVAPGRTIGHGNKIGVTAELVRVATRPRQRGFDVLNVARPAMPGSRAIFDGHTDPPRGRQMRHQRIALQDPRAVDPSATGHEHQDGALLRGEVTTAPDIDQLMRGRAVAKPPPVQKSPALVHLLLIIIFSSSIINNIKTLIFSVYDM